MRAAQTGIRNFTFYILHSKGQNLGNGRAVAPRPPKNVRHVTASFPRRGVMCLGETGRGRKGVTEMSSGIPIYGGGCFYGDNIRGKFSAYCTECEMLFRNGSGYEGGDDCPNDGCSNILTDADEQQGIWDSFS